MEQEKLIKRAQLASVLVAITICIIKTYGWFLTSSVTLLASLIDSILDVTSSVINMLALRLSLIPPDHNHRFGHNKIEDLAVFGQSIFIASSGIFALYSCFNHISRIDEISNSYYGIYLMIGCSILTIILILYQSYAIKRTNSQLLAADKLHYLSDLLTNLMVIASLYFNSMFKSLDIIFGILIACYVIYGSYNLFRKALGNLIDEEFSDADRQKIIDIIFSHKEILGVHEVKTRYAGNKPFIQFHIEMDGNMSLNTAHKISDKIMDAVNDEFEGAEVTIHQDPAGLEHHKPYMEKSRRKK